MIEQVYSNDVFLEITDKLKEVDDCKLSANTLYTYMVSGVEIKNTFTYASYDNDEMNGCLVLQLFNDMDGDKSLLMLFIWLDAHYPRLLEEFVNLGNDKAKELHAKKIYFIANKNEKVIERRTGKFGFTKAYITYRKEVI